MGHSLKPGVVTGEDYKTLLKAAGRWICTSCSECRWNQFCECCHGGKCKNRSDVIVQFSNSGGQFFAGKSLEDALRQRS